MDKKILVFIGEGVGNIIQMIPTVIGINKAGYKVDIALRSNFTGVKEILQIPEINNVYNVYVERIPEPKSYSKIVLTMFGHLESYKGWKEEFNGVEVLQDETMAENIGKVNDVELNFKLAREVGYDGPIPDTKISCPDTDSFQYFDNIICPGSGGENKRWPYFIEFAKELKGRVGIIGGPSEEKLPWPPNCVDMTGLLDLAETAAIIKKSSLYIGNDSGISHLANAVGTPSVIIWGPSHVVKSKPWNKNMVIVSKNMHCQPCFLLQSETKCEKKGIPNECLTSVTIKEVVEATEYMRENSEWRSEEEYTKHWQRHTKIMEDVEESELIDEVKNVFEQNNISGDTCLDMGCGDGRFIPVLNRYFKNIKATDIIDQEIPKLNGVEFEKIPIGQYEVDKKYDCIFLSRFISSAGYQTFVESMKGKFKNLVIVDLVKDLNKETKKTKPIDIEKLQQDLGIELITETEVASGSDNISIITGVANEPV